MKKRLAIFSVGLLLVSLLFLSVQAEEENLNNVVGITSLVYDGGALWGVAGQTLYRSDPEGQISAKIVLSQVGEQLAYDGRNLLLSQNKTKKIFTIDQTTGVLTLSLELTALAAPAEMFVKPLTDGEILSLTYHANNLWIGCGAGYCSSIYEVDPISRNVLSHRFSTGPTPTALYVRNGHLWVLDKDGAALRCIYNKEEFGRVEKIDIAQGAGTLAVIGEKIVFAGPSMRGVTRGALSLTALDTALLPANLIAPEKEAPPKPFTYDQRDGKYALLISGDTADQGFDEFWTDCIFLAKTLHKECGFSPENIHFLYYKGNASSLALPSYYKDDAGYLKGSSYKANIEATLGNIANKKPSELFIYTFDHGSSSLGLCIPETDIYPNDFDGYLKELYEISPETKVFIYMQQCYSGGFWTEYIKGRKATAILTACNNKQSAYRSQHTESLLGKTWHHGEFNWWFMGALAKKHPHGDNTGADAGAAITTATGLREYVIKNAAGSEQEFFSENDIGSDWP